MQAQAELHYKVRWRPRGGHPGHHPSTHQGGGLEFRHLVPLADEFVLARHYLRIEALRLLRAFVLARNEAGESVGSFPREREAAAFEHVN